MDNIKQLCDSHGIVPRTLIEVGAAHPTTYRLEWYVKNGYKTILVEANPRLCYCLREGWNWGDFKGVWATDKMPPSPYEHPGVGKHDNLTVLNKAIVDIAGPVKFFERNASSFVTGIKSPAVVNDGYSENDADAYIVNGITIDSIDDCQVDVLLSDTEGCEWFCIKNLISRPKLIVLELRGQNYTNPFQQEIAQWLSDNGYEVVANDDTDSAFIKVR